MGDAGEYRLAARTVKHATVRLVSAGAVMVLLLCAPAQAREPSRFDPSTCKTDAHGKLTIALGRIVLAVPNDGVVVTGGIYPGSGDEPLRPPDSSELEGCPGNPKQLTSFAFAYFYQEALEHKHGKSTDPQPKPDLLTLYKTILGSRVATVDDEAWPGEALQLEVSEGTCDHAAIREELANGLRACRIKPASEHRLEDWGASYVARSESYATPLGKPFVVNCSAMLFTRRIGQCDVAYAMAPGLGVAYRFQPYRGSHPIPIDQIIDFDRGLRASIAQAMIKDYAWPNQGSEK